MPEEKQCEEEVDLLYATLLFQKLHVDFKEMRLSVKLLVNL